MSLASPVHDVEVVHVADRAGHLFEHGAGPVVRDGAPQLDVLEQVAVPRVLHRDVNLG